MKRTLLKQQLAITAIGALFALPSFAQDTSTTTTTTTTTTHEHHLLPWVTDWTRNRDTVIDRVNGNDFRDNRDSTIMRNDVPLDQTTLPDGTWRDKLRTENVGNASTYSTSQPSYSESTTHTAALPATAVREADQSNVAMQNSNGQGVIEPRNVEQSAQLHGPITAEPDQANPTGNATADETVIKGAPESKLNSDSAQSNQYNSQYNSSAQSNASDQGLANMTTPANDIAISPDAVTNSSSVTARNLSGVEPVNSGVGPTVNDGTTLGRDNTSAGLDEQPLGQ